MEDGGFQTVYDVMFPEQTWIALRKAGRCEFTDQELAEAKLDRRPIAYDRPVGGMAQRANMWVEDRTPFVVVREP
jgi:hypothetical protein